MKDFEGVGCGETLNFSVVSTESPNTFLPLPPTPHTLSPEGVGLNLVTLLSELLTKVTCSLYLAFI